MKNTKYIYIAFALLMLASGCKKSFLDEKPSEKVSPEQISEEALRDPSVLNAYTRGLYSSMYNTGTGGTTGHDDFGQKGYDIFSDMLASDMALGSLNYGWYSTVIRYQATKDFTQNAAYIPWRYYYQIIFSANSLIDILGGNNATFTNKNLAYSMGQAKAMRAYAYFYLTQFYAAQGYGTGSEKILPLYTDAKTTNQPLATSAVIFDQMIKDLTDAAILLADYGRGSKGEINADVAKGLLAYVYAARGTTADLAQVVSLTDQVIPKFPVLAKANVTTDGFNNLPNSANWMWGADLQISSNLDLVSWWGQIDIFTYSYAWAGDPKFIDDKLYASIPADDARKEQFDDNADYGGLLPTGKFFDPARIEGGQRTVITDYVYMRVEEMILLNAEAKARLNQDALARTEIKKLLTERVANPNFVDALSGTALKEEIYKQTRIELWGEGKVYLAMKRNKHSITRGTNHLFFAGDTFAYDADELTFPIPQAEVINNPNLNK
ncbi:RagB/SusD family nutrient uptake outer membrane protein [Pedobacter petrophilus]|uniref:RagB/SusD family nutrient uptake outer membrane protein n=1 Tax=Pedobacter petrophilus TaxID=1908241 RepID=A0A7K0FZ58_9SPHI|nr:RagB/SusD family nutrient uptake outer membrane protein [Pedobacter petrophilus]MRX76374.1 RagB/SusD family nutrient uptake outer membrane protein [Pedobacter petrophilus]